MILPSTPASLIPLEFYCDSSSHRNHDYMVAGGLAIRRDRYQDIESCIQEIKKAAGIRGEMKWSDYRGGRRRHAYEALIDYLFLLVRERQAAFHSMIAHFKEFDHKAAGSNTPDTSTNKMHFQLNLHRVCRFYGRRCRIYVFPDAGNDSAELPGFREVLCASAFKKYRTKPNCLRAIHPQNSEKHNILQMVDVAIGAIAAKRNGRRLSDHKANLADYVQEKSQHPDWAIDTPKNARFFTVWNFHHQEM